MTNIAKMLNSSVRVSGFKTTVNKQAICESEIAKREVFTVKEAEEMCLAMNDCSFLCINFNKQTEEVIKQHVIFRTSVIIQNFCS